MGGRNPKFTFLYFWRQLRLCRTQMAKPLQFLHITKCAGTSLENWGRKNGFKWGRFFKGTIGQLKSPHENGLRSERHHVPPSFFVENPYASYDLFVVVRDPFDRAISEFRCPWKGFRAPAKTKEARDQRANATKEDLNNWLSDRMGKMRAPFKTCHLIPQSAYIFDESDNAVIPAERVLKFENLTEDLTRLCAEIGLPEMKLVHANASEMPFFDYHSLTEEVRNLLRLAYARDFELLSYSQRAETSQSL